MAKSSASWDKLCRVCDNPLSAGGGKSREHVIPDWMQKHFGLTGQRICYTPMESSGIPTSLQLTPGAPERLKRAHNYGSMLLGAVCAKCNNGWMSGLEGAAKADLITLIEGSTASNAPDTVARWALKTAYVLAVATDPPVGRVPQRHVLYLRQSSGLPAGVSVFFRTDPEPEWWFSSSVTFLVDGGGAAKAFMSSVGMKHYRNAYRYFFRLGRLTLMVQFWPNSVDAVGYNEELVRPLAAGVELCRWSDGGGYKADQAIHDLAIRSTMCRVNSRPTGDYELCACGSGLLSSVCRLLDHPDDTAGNWGAT